MRSKIVDALIVELKKIDGTGEFKSNLFQNVGKKFVFWEEVNDFPHVFVTTGAEQREYQASRFTWAHLGLTVRVYVKGEDPEEELEKILEDIEFVVDNNLELEYETGKTIEDIRILSISTDQGLLAPFGIGEITLNVRYDVPIRRL